MKNKKDTQKELNSINILINLLQEKKVKLEKSLMDSAESTKEKFLLWFNSDNKDEDGFIPSHSNPLLVKWYDDNRELRRYQTCDICEDLYEYFICWFDPEWFEEWQTPLTEEGEKEMNALAEELMKTNLGRFTYDW
jgi:hypothetical protein